MEEQHEVEIVLASSSPYRRILLEKICTQFESHSPNIDERPHTGESPRTLSQRLALEKAQALTQLFPHHLIIGSDQVAMLGNTQLNKPGSHENAVRQLEQSSGQTINFYTSLCVLNSRTKQHISDIDTCSVTMKALGQKEIENYVRREKPFDCAAAFKSEGLGIALFEKIEGEDPNALIGLPLIKLVQLLDKHDYNVLSVNP
jgi:MAF protein